MEDEPSELSVATANSTVTGSDTIVLVAACGSVVYYQYVWVI